MKLSPFGKTAPGHRGPVPSTRAGSTR